MPKILKGLDKKWETFHARIQEFLSGGGGGGGPGQSDKKALTTCCCFLVLSVKWSISKKSIIFQGSRGGPTFSRGVQLFPGGGGGEGGVQLLIPYRTHITCGFPGGSGPPVPPPPPPPLWIRTCFSHKELY